MASETIRYLECSGGPREMGRQYGEGARDAIRNNVETRGSAGSVDAHGAYIDMTLGLLKRRAPDVLSELEGLAEGSGVAIGPLVMENSTGSPRGSCTSMAIPASPVGPVLGKNNDGGRDGRRWVVRKTTPDRGHGSVMVLSAGWLSGLDGMNAAGLASGHNSVGSVFDRPAESMEIRLWTHHLMQQCSTVEEFVEGMNAIPLNGKGFNLVVADAAGAARVLECAVPRIVGRSENAHFIYATNHYVTDELKNADRRTPEGKTISTYRYGHLSWREQSGRPTTDDEMRELLTSHEPWAPCRHGGPHRSFTLWSMIALPAQRRVRVAYGPPCECEYVPHGL